ncbi:FtsX-like permease family protein [Chitinophaga dinghuensis]|uniref:FtsX-like permease family protein n=1 Tax=Chitinophaga dinghuensis TaxID=1539050 RepID=A0A327W2J0_9BACT|nr:ABC transporter permease [Chitinophaga dinghuensis]RAJ82254.1 FtsX-like permease family protein [Chitinophaga dinghuensis]
MFKHNLRLIFRNFKRFKSVFVINLVGLSTGLAAAILIFLWVNDERSTDRFHHNSSHLFQVMVNTTQDGRITTDEGTGGILGETLERSVPEVSSAVTTAPAAWFQKFNMSFKDNTVSAKGNFVGSSYFHVFSFDLLQGDKNQVLSNKTGIVLSETLARKLFHTTDNIIGKVIEWKWTSIVKQCIVTGVYKDMPNNSTQQYDFVLPLEAWKEIVPATNDIAGGPFRTYVVLKDGTNTDQFNQKFGSFLHDKVKGSNATLFLRNYADAYLHGKYENGKLAGGRIEYIRLFIIIAIAILLIACVNFMNLSTARASGRMKEVGVKKALGIKPHLLIMQFLGESVLMSFISLILAVVFIWLLLPQFNQITGKHLSFGWNPALMGTILGITLLTGLLAGSYPAFYLSRFKPVLTLKGKLISSAGELWVRRGSVIFQFVICVLFVSAMMVVYQQIQYVQTKDLGFNKENVIYFELEGSAAEKRDAFLAELDNMPGIISASTIQQKVILPSGVPNSVIQWDGKNSDGEIRFCEMPVNYGLIETLGIQMAQGRPFSRQFSTDAGGIVLNEAAIAAMNLTENPIGKVVSLNGKDTRIIGVSKNFHFNSLHDEIKPFIFRLSPDETMLVMARIQAGKTAATLQRVQQYYKDFNPGYTFDYQFLDIAYQEQYASEQLVASLSKYFTGLAIIISCLGLFGLAAFTAERRAKEIGVRKVMGATAANIVYLLSIDFTKIVLVAIVIALPLSYVLTRHWLDSFAYRIHLSAVYFVAAAVISLLVAWFTIGLQTIKASRVNPLLYLKED